MKFKYSLTKHSNKKIIFNNKNSSFILFSLNNFLIILLKISDKKIFASFKFLIIVKIFFIISLKIFLFGLFFV